MASKKYQGPYSAVGTFPASWEVEEWEVVMIGTVEGQSVRTPIVPPRTYKHRTAAIRRATTLNKQWLKKRSSC